MDIKRIQIKLLELDKCKYLRTIKLSGKDWNVFTAFISYYRDHNLPEIDELDNSILEGLKSYSVDAEFYSNYEIYLEGQAEKIMEKIESSVFEDITIQLNPKTNDELYKQALLGNVYCYPRIFKAQIFGGLNYSGINKYLHAYLEYHTLENLITTIEPNK